MHWRNIAPFCRDDDPQTGPTIRFPATSRHSGLTKVSTTESHGRGRKESLKFILSHSAAQRCVHALAPARGRQREIHCFTYLKTGTRSFPRARRLFLFRLGLVPERVHFGERRLAGRLAARLERTLDRGKAALEILIG